MRSDSTPKSPAKFVGWEPRWQLWRVRVKRNGRSVFDKSYKDLAEAIAVSTELVAVYCPPRPPKIPKERKERIQSKPKNDLPRWKRPEQRETYRAAHRRLYERRRAWYREFMCGRVCDDCIRAPKDGEHFHWHHIDPASKFKAVGRMVNNYSAEDVLAEISKCKLVCAECHRKYHRKGN